MTPPAAEAPPAGEAYVWMWLPDAAEPVVVGRLSRDGARLVFNYGRSYLARPDRIAVYAPELPLRRGILPLVPGLSMPSAIRDASPDAWGRRVILARLLGRPRADAGGAELDELTYFIESGSDRIGALDFQRSPAHYEPREHSGASLADLAEATDRVDKNLPLNPALDEALRHGTSIGGARPKVLLDDAGRKLIAKFSSSDDRHSVVKAEFVAMRLAHRVGLQVARVELARVSGKDVLLVERFDRRAVAGAWHRRALVSALTLLELDEMMARYASYETLAEIVRHRFVAPKATLRELFGRLVFNILVGNTDDHARNHSAFWDGERLSLTPAYDICPQLRAGGEAGQAMRIVDGDNRSRLATCLAAAPRFLLTPGEAIAMIRAQLATVRGSWDAVCDEAGLTGQERAILWNGALLKAYAFEGLDLDPA